MDDSKRRKVLCGGVAAIVTVGVLLDTMLSPSNRRRKVPRIRMDWETRRDSLSDRKFKRRYRISKRAFSQLEGKIYPYVARQLPIAGEPAVSSELCLSMTLRWLAGGSFVDIVDMHGVSIKTFYSVLWLTIEAIDKVDRFDACTSVSVYFGASD